MTTAVAYLRTSSRTNLDGDSAPRQRQTIEEYAKRRGLHVVKEFYDEAVKGADHIHTRPGFQKLLDYLAGNGAKVDFGRECEPLLARPYCAGDRA